MATYAEELNLRLFLEGLEVPVIGANISMSADFPASASIQIIATPQALRLSPRTLVHLFFLDKNSKAKTPVGKIGEQPYSLLFCGELMSISFSKSEGARNITLSCKDHRSYYDRAYTYLFRSSSLNGNTQNTSIESLLKSKGAFAGANSSLNFITNDGVAGFISQMFSDPRPTTPEFRNCTGVLGGILKSIETFTGLTSTSTGGANAFFSFAAARLNLLGQIGVYEDDTSSAKLLASEHMNALLKSKGDQLGELTDLNRVIRYILGFIYYKMSPNTCARFLPSKEFNINATAQSALSKARESLLDYIEALRTEFNTLSEAVPNENTLLTSAQFTKFSDAVFKIVFKLRAIVPDSFLNSLAVSSKDILNLDLDLSDDAFTKAFTRIDNPDYNSIYKDKWDNKLLYTYLDEIAKLLKSDPDVAYNFTKDGAKVVSCIISLVTISAPVLRNEAATGPLEVKQRTRFISNLRHGTFTSLLDSIIKYLLRNDKNIQLYFTQQSSPKLYTTLIAPDLFFSVAPTCNVLFPDMYFNLSYSRDLASETTRLQLSTAEDTEIFRDDSGVTKIQFYAPSTSDLRDMQSKMLGSAETSKAESAWTGNKLMNHELTTGIVPEFSFMSRMMLESALLTGISNSIPARNDFYIRIANYQFLKKRLETRQMSVTGVFNPSAVVGFPMVVIDSAYADTPKTSMLGNDTSEQFIGLLSSVSHSVSQQGGSSSYQLSHVRPHRSLDDDFIDKLNLGVTSAPSVATLKLNFSSILQEIINLTASPTMSSEDVISSDGSDLTNALKKMRILMSVTYYAGEPNRDYVVTPSSPFSVPIKDGQGFMQGNSVPTAPGIVRAGSKVKLSVGDKKEIYVLGVSVTNYNIAGGSKDIFGTSTGKDLIKQFTGKEDSSAKVNLQAYRNYIRKLASRASEVDVMQSILTKAISSVNANSTGGECLRLYIKNVTDLELIDLCKFYKLNPGRFLFTGFEEVELFYEEGTGNIINPPVEEAMRPSFVDSAYASPNIGPKVYQKLLGVGSIVDVSDEVLKSSGISKSTTSIGYSGGSSSGAYGETVEVVSQEDAIDIICRSYAKSPNKSEFSREYIYRDIANINDVLLSKQSVHYKAYATAETEDKRIPYMGLAIEVAEGEPLMEGFKEASPKDKEFLDSIVDPRVDVRIKRSNNVIEYINSLTSRGLKG